MIFFGATIMTKKKFTASRNVVETNKKVYETRVFWKTTFKTNFPLIIIKL